MIPATATWDVDARVGDWAHYHAKIGRLSPARTRCLPDFLIIAPGKTGTSWLSHHLGTHPRVFTPGIKECKFFCTNWRIHDIDWYVSRFDGAGAMAKGEASPTYSILPTFAIETIRAIKPNIKLIYVMRDPIERAWSHAKHDLKFQRANFRGYQSVQGAVPEEMWFQYLTHEWALSFGDYQSCLKRWLAVFPRENLFIGFFEDLVRQPEELLDSVLRFLEVPEAPDYTRSNDLHERVFAGLELERTEHITRRLSTIYKRSTLDLCRYLESELGMRPPVDWDNTLMSDADSEPICVDPDYRGYRLFLTQQGFVAVPVIMSGQAVSGRELTGTTPYDLRLQIDLYNARNGSSGQSRLSELPATVLEEIRLQVILATEAQQMEEAVGN